MWALSRKNLSSGAFNPVMSNQPDDAQLQRLAGMLKLCMKQFRYHTLHEANNKGSDQTVWMRRMVSFFVVLMQQSQVLSGFLESQPMFVIIKTKLITMHVHSYSMT